MDAIVFGGAVALVLWLVVFGWLGSWVATQCGREPVEGMLLGALLGAFGVLLEALLPKFPRERKRVSRLIED